MSKPKLKISAGKAAEDIRSGLNDSDMMQKYMLSPKGLVSLYKKLLEVGIVDQEDMDRRMNALETTMELKPSSGRPPVAPTPWIRACRGRGSGGRGNGVIPANRTKVLAISLNQNTDLTKPRSVAPLAPC